MPEFSGPRGGDLTTVLIDSLETGSETCETKGMRETIDLPEPVFETLRVRAERQGSNIETVILEAIRKDIAFCPTPDKSHGRVKLPLIRSSHPGSLRSLTNAEVDDLLG